MKTQRILTTAFVTATTIGLSSCKVNMIDRQYEVPWWVIAIPVVIFVIIALVVAGKCIASKKYVCPECNGTFKPKWWNASLSLHSNDERVFKCPHCGKKNFCHVSRDD